jgi:hypothetical protein
MGLFGLGSFGEGLVKGLAESATVSLQDEIGRIEDSIKSASDIRIKRIVQDQDRRREEAEKIVKALKRARANLGGVDSPEAAVRAASLLKKEGDLKSFNTLIDKISQRTDMDFDKYFGDVSKMSPAASDLDIAYSFIDETTIPLPSSEAGLEAVKPKGIMKYLGPDIDAEKLVEERTAEQMQMMDLGVRDIRKVAVPTIEFKEEAFKLDGMSSEDEFNYIQDKITKGNLTTDQKSFYSERANQLAGNMGLDKQMELAVQRLNNAQTANEKVAAQQEVMQLGRQKRKIDAFKTGSPTEVLKLNRIEALEDGNYEKAADLSKQLVSAGAMSFQDFMSSEIASIALGDLSPTESAARKQNLLEMSNIVNEVKKQMKPDEEVTVASLSATRAHINTLVQDKIAADPDLIKSGVYFETSELTGKQVMKFATKGTKEETQQLLAEKRKQYRAEVLEELKGQVTLDPSFDVIYQAYQSGVDVDSALNEAGTSKPKFSQEQIDTIKELYPNDAQGAEKLFQKMIEKSKGATVDISKQLELAGAAGFGTEFTDRLKELQASSTAEIIAEQKTKSSNITSAVEAVRNIPMSGVAGNKFKIDAISDALNIPASEAAALLPEVEAEISKQVQQEKEAQKAARPKRPDELLGDIRTAKTTDEYESAIAAYIERVPSADEQTIRTRYPFAQPKNKGGLMSKK